jgi:hypothetical protein
MWELGTAEAILEEGPVRFAVATDTADEIPMVVTSQVFSTLKVPDSTYKGWAKNQRVERAPELLRLLR